MKNLLLPALLAAAAANLNAQPMRNPAPRGPQVRVQVSYPVYQGDRRAPQRYEQRHHHDCCPPVYNPRQLQGQGCNEGNGHHHNAYAQARGMSQADFRVLLNMIDDRAFDSDRLALAKQACMGGIEADQVAAIMDRFSFESSRLAFAKYAYDCCIDPQNYYRANQAFVFSSSIQDLDRYLRH